MKMCDIFLIFAQNIDRGYTLEPPHNLCFKAKIKPEDQWSYKHSPDIVAL